jgi:hypothetical protein
LKIGSGENSPSFMALYVDFKHETLTISEARSNCGRIRGVRHLQIQADKTNKVVNVESKLE